MSLSVFSPATARSWVCWSAWRTQERFTQERFEAQPHDALGRRLNDGGLGCEPPVEQSRVGVAMPYGESRAVPLYVMGATADRDGWRTALPA